MLSDEPFKAAACVTSINCALRQFELKVVKHQEMSPVVYILQSITWSDTEGDRLEAS